MAERSASIEKIETFKDDAHVITWTGLTNGDTGSSIEMPGSSDRSIQFSGTFGAGGTIQAQGSNDGSNWIVLTDLQGNSISKTSASIEMITEVTRHIRVEVTAGDGTTDLTATLLLKRVQ